MNGSPTPPRTTHHLSAFVDYPFRTFPISGITHEADLLGLASFTRPNAFKVHSWWDMRLHFTSFY